MFNKPFRSSGVTMTTNLIALSFLNISYDQRRIDLIHLTAAIPLFAIKTLKNQRKIISLITKINNKYIKFKFNFSQQTQKFEFEFKYL